MPELPEVETVCQGLQSLVEQEIKEVFRSNKKMRFESTLDLKHIHKAKITEITRRARFLIINFNNDKSLILHLGMSGKITRCDDFKHLKHDHFALFFSDHSWMVFNDPRRFGFIDLIESQNLKTHKMLAKLGPEPISKLFNDAYLKEKLQKKKMNIKTAMMDNEIVVGVGNIYINESLFDAKISPLRESSSLTNSEIKTLILSIKKIIKKAIKLGGSSINDYVDAKGDLGYFQNSFKVYDRDQENCLLCNHLVRKIKQNGRSSFFCANCQN